MSIIGSLEAEIWVETCQMGVFSGFQHFSRKLQELIKKAKFQRIALSRKFYLPSIQGLNCGEIIRKSPNNEEWYILIQENYPFVIGFRLVFNTIRDVQQLNVIHFSCICSKDKDCNSFRQQHSSMKVENEAVFKCARKRCYSLSLQRRLICIHLT